MTVRDHHLGRVLQTEHDLTDRPMGTQLRNEDGSLIYRTELDYDTQNRLVGFGEEADGDTYKTSYTYDNDNRVTEIGFGASDKVKYTYDNLGRIASRTAECGADAGKVVSSYTYVAGGHGTGSTTPLVAKITQPKISFEYSYDSRSNIISEKCGSLTTTYAYDALGQLIRVNDPHENATWVYNYDRGGNITSNVKYAYTTGALGTAQQTISYTYGDSNWKDKLTVYNGKTITYDAIGNPTNDGTWTYTWQAGRQLKQMSKSGTTVQFKYDHNGLRVGKIVNGTETKYILHGKLIAHMTCGSDNLHFFYDAQSKPAKVNFNGAMYTYVYNLQGDIVGILDSTANLIVEYKYDAWGRTLATTGLLAGTLGKRNPFRYRGYVYDEETGLYSLRSRYYNPERIRFVNADALLGKVRSLSSHNAFAYCVNTPICKTDPDGNVAFSAIACGIDVFLSLPLGKVVATAVIGAMVSGLYWIREKASSISNIHAPTITLSTAARTASELQGALLKAGTSYAGSRDHSFNTGDYYFAFILRDRQSQYGYLVYINEPLTIDEAETVLLTEDITHELMRAHGFGKRDFGIYTDMEGPAYDLAVLTGGVLDPKNHCSTNPSPGDYYWHYRAFGNGGPHIWFGSLSYKFN